MYFNPRMIQEVADRYGYPPVIRMEAPVDAAEFDFIRSTQYYGRCHDVTLYIFKKGQVAVNAKHHYPRGLYRAPSGGLKPGERFEDGVLREVHEETGLKIELGRYVLQVNVSFTFGTRIIPWKTHVMTAKYKSGRIKPVDIREIREAKWADMAEFDDYRTIIEFLDSGGLKYRARLHDEVVKLL